MNIQVQKLERNIDLVESVKDAIFDAILTGKLVPGEKLSQDMLAEQLGVSRQPIGQALRILLEHGIVCPLDKKSLTVAAIEHDNLMQLIDIRCELDCFAARLAAGKAKAGAFDDADLATLNALRQLKAKYGSDVSQVAFDDAVLDDIEFHRLIRKLSGNDYIQAILAPHLLHHHRLMYIMSNNRRPVIWAEHNLIFEAIEAGDVAEAQALVRHHIVDAAEVLRSRLTP
ncbi:GntR family transcriptional regulator [Pseudogemmobacter sp. W21_MBD1_M6]|uniref:GntR family transcriptional regulator n=1 Tax=Pseudogemmobacter sp. W21_MBD1_M6 TaxID=3240271 RepID=UPI003F993A8E